MKESAGNCENGTDEDGKKNKEKIQNSRKQEMTIDASYKKKYLQK